MFLDDQTKDLQPFTLLRRHIDIEGGLQRGVLVLDHGTRGRCVVTTTMTNTKNPLKSERT